MPKCRHSIIRRYRTARPAISEGVDAPMTRPPFLTAMLALIWGCLNSADLYACQVQLQIQNRSVFTILEVEYRQQDINFWSNTSISDNHPLYSGQSRIIGWDGNGDYEIKVTLSSAPTNPAVKVMPDICGRGQIIILNDGINIL